VEAAAAGGGTRGLTFRPRCPSCRQPKRDTLSSRCVNSILRNRRPAAAVLQESDARQDEYGGKVAKRMNHVSHHEDADEEHHDRRDLGNARSSDGAKVLDDVVVDDVSQAGTGQPEP
jgi:hypothetical protein